MIVRQAYEDPSDRDRIEEKKKRLREKVRTEKAKAVEPAADEGSR